MFTFSEEKEKTLTIVARGSQFKYRLKREVLLLGRKDIDVLQQRLVSQKHNCCYEQPQP